MHDLFNAKKRAYDSCLHEEEEKPFFFLCLTVVPMAVHKFNIS